MHEIEFSYVIDAINDEGTTATVTYTPHDDRLKAVTRNVSVPLAKARDQEHAREILHQKCRQRAPLHEWNEARDLLEGRQGVDVRATVAELRESVVGRQQRIEPPKQESREDRIRREFLAQ